MMVDPLNELEDANGQEPAGRARDLLPGGTVPMLVGMASGVLLGMLAGIRIGKAKGESVGLTKGIELGRLEAMSLLPEPQPRIWRRLWRRAGTKTE